MTRIVKNTKHIGTVAMIILFSNLNLGFANEVSMLPGVKPIHLVWIGSPLRTEQYAYIRSLCSHLNSYHTKARIRSYEDLTKIYLWKDQSLLGSQNFIDLRVLNPECRNSIEVKDVSELCRPDDEVRQAVGMAVRTLPQLTTGSVAPATSCGPGEASPPASGSTIDCVKIKKAYSNLNKARGAPYRLGNSALAPMVDLIKTLAVYEFGGIYFDVNKDFSRLKFQSSTLDLGNRGTFNTCNKVIVGGLTTVVATDSHLNNARFFPRFYDQTLPNAQLNVQVDGRLYARHLQGFYNMDYLGATCPRADALADHLNTAASEYELLFTNPILKLFLTKKMESVAWVFSIGGPAGFTKNIMQSRRSEILNISQTAPYLGAASWRSPPNPRPLAPLVLQGMLKVLRDDPYAAEILAECWSERNRAVSTTPSTLAPSEVAERVLPMDVEVCAFKRILEGISRPNQFTPIALRKLNDLGEFYLVYERRLSDQIKELCRSSLEAALARDTEFSPGTRLTPPSFEVNGDLSTIRCTGEVIDPGEHDASDESISVPINGLQELNFEALFFKPMQRLKAAGSN